MNILVLGANSVVAYEIAKKFAQAENADISLASRDIDSLEKKASDIRAKYNVNVTTTYIDAGDFESHNKFYNTLSPKPDGVVLAFGYYCFQNKAQADFKEVEKAITINYTGAVSLLEIIAEDFQKRGHGFIIGISSVSGDRGRKSNYLYGSSKAAFTTYLNGLRNRLFSKNVRVLTVIAGYMRTKATEKLDLPKKLMAEPEEVADKIYWAYKKKKNIVYIKWFWRLIMLIIKHIPESLFKRTSI